MYYTEVIYLKKDRKCLPDTPWHIGYALKDEDDPRRHKARCIFNIEDICKHPESGAFTLACAGSAHCKFYKDILEITDEEINDLEEYFKEIASFKEKIRNFKTKSSSSKKCRMNCGFKRSDGHCMKLKADLDKTYNSDCPYYASNNLTISQIKHANKHVKERKIVEKETNSNVESKVDIYALNEQFSKNMQNLEKKKQSQKAKAVIKERAIADNKKRQEEKEKLKKERYAKNKQNQSKNRC